MRAKVIIEVTGGCVSNVEFQHLLLLIEPAVVIVDYDNMPDDTDEDTYYRDLVAMADRPAPTVAERRLDRYVWSDAEEHSPLARRGDVG